MRSLGFAALAAGLALIPTTSVSAGDSDAQARRWGNVPHARIRPPAMRHGGPRMRHGPRWGHRIKGRWHAGWGAPGGWAGHRFPMRGFQLPTYWIAPTYHVPYQVYQLPAPPAGYNWSRYYDDAVLIDGEGRVQDSRRGVEWDRYEGGYDEDYDDGPPPPHGADYPPPGYPRDYAYDSVTGGHSGVWEGTWKGSYDGRPYKFEGSFDGEYRPAGADYPPPPRHDGRPPPHHGDPRPHHAPGHNPAIVPSGSTVIIGGAHYPAGGYVANGYYYPPAATTTVTVQVQPVVTRHVTERLVYAKAKKRWKPRHRAPACPCK